MLADSSIIKSITAEDAESRREETQEKVLASLRLSAHSAVNYCRYQDMIESLRRHWPEYLMEAAGLAVFMVSAGLFGTLLGYPGSPVHQAIEEPLLRRALMGLAMGLTAIAIIYSPWGQQSGAHINPAVTLTFLRLGKVAPWDAVFYIIAQFAGGLYGVLLVGGILGEVFV
jgi:aquaporin Z